MISNEEYVGFHYYIRQNMDELIRELKSHGAINSEEAFNLINKFNTDTTKVSREQVNILMKILDVDGKLFVIM